MTKAPFSALLLILLVSCSDSKKLDFDSREETHEKHLVSDVSLYDANGNIQAVVEIPAGSREKWEVNKTTGIIERDSMNGEPRIIDYLGYPVNYGFIPQTVLAKEFGGDGDPLDAIILGETRSRGEIVSCKILGILQLKDGGEQDDKLILVNAVGAMSTLNSLDELEQNYPKALSIIEEWFVNYKGPDVINSDGYAGKNHADSIFKIAQNQFVN
ncbi:MAG: inorganic diphosphatase [bacterium]|nr:inorganic diphosphatase [bacterium]